MCPTRNFATLLFCCMGFCRILRLFCRVFLRGKFVRRTMNRAAIFSFKAPSFFLQNGVRCHHEFSRASDHNFHRKFSRLYVTDDLADFRDFPADFFLANWHTFSTRSSNALTFLLFAVLFWSVVSLFSREWNGMASTVFVGFRFAVKFTELGHSDRITMAVSNLGRHGASDLRMADPQAGFCAFLDGLDFTGLHGTFPQKCNTVFVSPFLCFQVRSGRNFP